MTVAIIDYSNCGLFLMRKLQLETTNYVNGVETLMENDLKKIAYSSLKEAWHKMDNLYNFYAKSVGINFTIILVLQILFESEDVAYTQKELCDKLGLPKQLVNNIMKSFWEQGYVQLREAKDRRNKEIIVTDKGKSYAAKVLKPLEDAESDAWDCFSAEELANLAKTMEKFTTAFEGTLMELNDRK